MRDRNSSSPTHFALWRAFMGYSRAEAARRLNVSTMSVRHWDFGRHSNGGPSVPPFATRVVMDLLARGETPRAWPAGRATDAELVEMETAADAPEKRAA